MRVTIPQGGLVNVSEAAGLKTGVTYICQALDSGVHVTIREGKPDINRSEEKGLLFVLNEKFGLVLPPGKSVWAWPQQFGAALAMEEGYPGAMPVLGKQTGETPAPESTPTPEPAGQTEPAEGAALPLQEGDEGEDSPTTPRRGGGGGRRAAQ